MPDVFRIEGPALISFSGGRTSSYMLHRIVQAWGGTLPDDVHVTFANTGKEMAATLDFVRDCGERFGVRVRWLEYRRGPDGPTFAEVDHATASRNGEPFKALIDAKGYLPNPVTRFCTSELKIRTINCWIASIGGTAARWTKVIGLRADEPHRVARLRGRSERGEGELVAPLHSAGITVRDVAAFWAQQNLGLDLPTVNGRTPLGNCDLCFLKSAATIAGIMRERPELAQWWIEAEAEARASKPLGARFRKDRPGYAELLGAVQNQTDMFEAHTDDGVACFCNGDS